MTNPYLLPNDLYSLLFIGDVHGRVDKLNALLEQECFIEHELVDEDEKSDFYTSRVVFVGDLIDNSHGHNADHITTLERVKYLMDKGVAHCVMGNHELNAIGWLLKNDQGQPLRKHSDKNRKQHALFLEQLGENSELHHQWVNWFKTLPIFIDFGSITAIHACWKSSIIEKLKPYLNSDNSLKSEYWHNAFDEQHELLELLEVALKGPEYELPASYSFKDKTGFERRNIRAKWWMEDATTYADVAQVPASEVENIPEITLAESARIEPLDKPVIVGHYTLFGVPKLQSSKVACVDYNGARDSNPLVGYRFELQRDESDLVQLDDEQFTFSFKRETMDSVSKGKLELLEGYLDSLPAIGEHELKKYHHQLEAISDTLRLEWDPIGVGSEPEMDDEYYAYIQPVLQLLLHSERNVLAYYLLACEQEYMGVERECAELSCGLVANQLTHAWDLNQPS
ncbi:metallophosphoesterase [Vibrio tapetis]|uniref:Metallophosphoesterase n=1 Tax=Vibrio tapetis subsp. tapetis TaxID=1671868 RepID=A0A2N8ZMF5_9VIBR|nr:metallophosphoesterase [Vibrio tapetis]SON53095.1 Metallophosphoesterase [Vibrio tapetis subsp. tapetis]